MKNYFFLLLLIKKLKTCHILILKSSYYIFYTGFFTNKCNIFIA
ncbi:hypothetical protein MuYL_3457 [Mucilaginibacter xinganensis]|uniref:Uncharacterized protein n=1 Tax=Mucilaginibacter xinganensis TaxID=1234841 RepID=A0A223NZQ5_9SPHI|nr:hypothetical protein MuYL_3457 [Mucilaginibacter xinganensis]